MQENRGSFSGQFGVLVALAGSAVGLGNLWRFPYLVGTNGGAAFILIYLFFILIICLPILLSEFVIGRRSQSNPVGAFKILAPGSKWGIIGVFGVLAAGMILSFYSVVGGWSVDYFWKAITFQFGEGADLANMFETTVTTSFRPLIFFLIFMLMTGVIVGVGIEKGIEKFSKMMMPLLFILVIILAIRSMTLPGSKEGLMFLFKPDFSKVTGQTLLNAMGQAFFSLSVGCGTVMTYASYVRKSENMVSISTYTIIADTLFAIIAGLAIMPAVFAFGLEPGQGPGLVFMTLPYVFGQMPLGSIIAILFFFVLIVAALTSAISLLEVVVCYVKEEFKLSRVKAVVICFSVITIFGVLCSLSQGVLSDVKILGLNFFDLFDKTSANVLLPAGALLMVIFVGWKLDKVTLFDELTSSGKHKIAYWLLEYFRFIIRYIAPVVIACIMVGGLL